MAYSELIKSFDRIREYMREFYVYGFKSRSQYDGQSGRSYDNERRRIESWLGEYMSFRRDSGGKNVFLSVDSRRIAHNPLYKAFQAKSFTAKDLTLHFYILDILDGGALTAGEIAGRIHDGYLSRFPDAFSLDDSTVRKKLKEYEKLGLLRTERRGREVLYRRTDDPRLNLASWADALDFYAEENPLGVVGFFLLDKGRESSFRFKHHYILHALDSQILCQLLEAIGERRAVELTVRSLRTGRYYHRTLCPLKIYRSVQTGRQYLLGYHYQGRRMVFFRLDAVKQAVLLDEDQRFASHMASFAPFDRHLWGVSTGQGRRLDHLEMTLRVDKGEEYILRRLEREKRHGAVEALDGRTCRFTADVYDAWELLPWLRTFMGRVVSLRCSRQEVADAFYGDVERMASMYGEGPDRAV